LAVPFLFPIFASLRRTHQSKSNNNFQTKTKTLMKKFFTLIAMGLMALGVQAQQIAFAEADVASAGTLNNKVFQAGNFKLTITDTANKVAIDKNAQYFGDATTQAKSAGARLKTGGKSSSKNLLTATIPAAGTLKIWARSGSSSATDRNVVLTQGETELFNSVVKDDDAVSVAGLVEADPAKETAVYPVISVAVAAGDVVITYPVGSMNFYAFEFVEGGTSAIENIQVQQADGTQYNLAGQQVANGYKGLVIKNGKKVVMK
jgi:hypothetical protein